MTAAPVSTYRLQLQPGFGFADAAAIADYLAALGVTHVYLSPILQAAPGSVHGYDVVDHSRISADLGGEAAFRAMVAAVPPPRPWRDRRHRAQPHGHPGARVAQPAVLVGAPGGDRVAVRALVRHRLGGAGRPAAAAHPGRAGRGLPRRPHRDCRQPVAAAGGRSSGLAAPEPRRGPRPGTSRCSATSTTCCRSAPAPPACRWRICSRPSTTGWPAGATPPTELNWRRFFDVTSLIAVRVEDRRRLRRHPPAAARLVAEGLIDGLRVDHPDGLADPRGYLERLAKATGGAWVVTEKILTGERGTAIGLAVRGHHRLRRARHGRRPLRRPGRPRAADRGLHAIHQEP